MVSEKCPVCNCLLGIELLALQPPTVCWVYELLALQPPTVCWVNELLALQPPLFAG